MLLQGGLCSQYNGTNFPMICMSRLVIIVAILAALVYQYHGYEYVKIAMTPLDQPHRCPVPEKIKPGLSQPLEAILTDGDYRRGALKRLAGAVAIDTTVIDNAPLVDEDPGFWKRFDAFADYLAITYPNVHSVASVEKVNTHGLVLTWKGSNSTKKPLLLMAHQDVVPVPDATLNEWAHPPFAGMFDDDYIYGRGAFDCKNLLISVMELMELLISSGYNPERTVIAAFGFDEEIGGRQGAKHIALFLEQHYGKDSMFAIIDEGVGLLDDPISHKVVAIAGAAEKGYSNIVVELSTVGGHALQPPTHTGIGVMADLATFLENHPNSPKLTGENPFLRHLECAAVHSEVKDLKTMISHKLFLAARESPVAANHLLDVIGHIPMVRDFVRTSQSINVFEGGDKYNALPEHAKMVINTRIAIEESVEFAHQVFVDKVTKIATKHNYSVIAFGEHVVDGSVGAITVSSLSDLEPAPRTPIVGDAWKMVAGTTRYVFEDFVFPELGYPVITVPTVFPANTDTRHYWNLTSDIYRFSPQYLPKIEEYGIHSLDEKIPVDSHLQLIGWYFSFIQNVNNCD